MVEGASGFRVARGAQQVEEITRAVGIRGLGGSVGDEPVEERQPSGAELGAAAVLAGGILRRKEKVEQTWLGVLPAIAEEHSSQVVGVAAHFQREHGLPGDGECEMLHVRQQLDRPVLQGCQPGLCCGAGGDHMPGQDRHGARGEGRGNGPPLVAPGIAFGEEQATAQHRLQHPPAGGVAPVVVGVRDQYLAYGVWRVHHDLAAAEEVAGEDLLLVGRPPPELERVATQNEERLELCALAMRQRRARRISGEHRG